MDLTLYEKALVFEPYDEEKHGSQWDLKVGLILKLKKGKYKPDLYLVGNINPQFGQCDCCSGNVRHIEGVAHIKQLFKE